jgi:hypothetical protein
LPVLTDQTSTNVAAPVSLVMDRKPLGWSQGVSGEHFSKAH